MEKNSIQENQEQVDSHLGEIKESSGEFYEQSQPEESPEQIQEAQPDKEENYQQIDADEEEEAEKDQSHDEDENQQSLDYEKPLQRLDHESSQVQESIDQLIDQTEEPLNDELNFMPMAGEESSDQVFLDTQEKMAPTAMDELPGKKKKKKKKHKKEKNFEIPYDQELEEQTAHMNMIYCHSLTQGIPAVFYKYQKMMRDHLDTVEDSELVLLIKSQLVSFEQMNQQPISKNERILLSEAFKQSVISKMTVITEDLIQFAKQNCFDLRISNKQIDFLLEEGNYEYLQLFIKENLIYQVSIPTENQSHEEQLLAQIQTHSAKFFTQEFINIERYLRPSDILKYVIVFKYKFLKENTELSDLVFESLINFQNLLDYRKWARIIFDFNMHEKLIQMLKDDDNEQDSFDVKFRSVSQDNKKKILKISPNQVNTLQTASRMKLVTAMLIQSIEYKIYNISVLIIKTFFHDIVSMNQNTLLDLILSQLSLSPSKYEVKLYLIRLLFPIFTKDHATRLLVILKNILENQKQSLYNANCNPIRLGFILYRTIDEMHRLYNCPQFISDNLKENVEDDVVQIIQGYQQIKELKNVLEKTDFEGLDSVWYIQKYEMKKVLEMPIIGQIIEEKWSGDMELESILEYSYFYRMFKNGHFVKSLKFEAKDHIAKYNVWKHSPKFRFFLDAFVSLGTAIFLQIYVNKFNAQFYICQEEVNYQDGEKATLRAFRKKLVAADYDVRIIVAVLLITNLFYPIMMILRMIHHHQSRKIGKFEVSAIQKVQFIQFLLFMVFFDITEKYMAINRENPFDIYRASYTILKENEIDPFKATGLPNRDTSEQDDRSVLLLNLIYYVPRYDLLLAFISVFAWIRSILYLRLAFPLIHHLTFVITHIKNFVLLWILCILAFICLFSLFFPEPENWSDSYYFIIELLFSGEFPEDLSIQAKITMLIFLMFNMIIMFNFIIAVFNTKIQRGQFNQLILQEARAMEYDEKYGSVVCVTTPLEVLFIPMSWTMYVVDSNEAISKILYLPVAVLITLVFAVLNTLVSPFLLLLKSLSLFFSIFDQLCPKLAAFILVELLLFTLCLPLLLFTCLSDPLFFALNLFLHNNLETTTFKIDPLSLNKFEQTLLEFDGIVISVKEINNKLRDKFQMQKQVRNMLFKGEKIQKEYQMYKQFIAKQGQGKVVDVRLIMNYVESIDQRHNILKANNKLRLPLGTDILAESIQEMLLMKKITETQDHMLQGIDEKVDSALLKISDMDLSRGQNEQ